MGSAMRSGLYLGLTLPLLLAMAVNAYGLTTFGKSQNTGANTQNNPPLHAARGRECHFEKDCLGIQNTSCVPDLNDKKITRCLCGDYTDPVNGACNSKVKGPHHACVTNEECIDGAECTPYQDGGKRGVDKVCKCKDGGEEVNDTCNGGVRNQVVSASLIAFALTTMLAGRLSY